MTVIWMFVLQQWLDNFEYLLPECNNTSSTVYLLISAQA